MFIEAVSYDISIVLSYRKFTMQATDLIRQGCRDMSQMHLVSPSET